MKCDLESLRRAKAHAEEMRRTFAKHYEDALSLYGKVVPEGKALVRTAEDKLQADKKGFEEAQKNLNECAGRLSKTENAQKEAENSVKMLQEDLKVAKQYLEMDRVKLSRALAAVDWSKVKTDEDRAAYERACREAEACRENVRSRERQVADFESKVGSEQARLQKLVAAVAEAKKEKEQLSSKCEKAKATAQDSEKIRDTVRDDAKKKEDDARKAVEETRKYKELTEVELKVAEENLSRAMDTMRDY
jgi:chromosome segregation ATPase